VQLHRQRYFRHDGQPRGDGPTETTEKKMSLDDVSKWEVT